MSSQPVRLLHPVCVLVLGSTCKANASVTFSLQLGSDSKAQAAASPFAASLTYQLRFHFSSYQRSMSLTAADIASSCQQT